MSEGGSNSGVAPDANPQTTQVPAEVKSSRWSFLNKAKEKVKGWVTRGVEDKNYSIGDENVKLSYKEFKPKEGEVKDPEEAIFFLVGAPVRAKASFVWPQLEPMANQLKTQVYTVDARPQGYFHSNSIDLEVEAIRRFIEDINKKRKEEGVKELKKITIYGHSIGGGVKGISLAVALEQFNPEIGIKAVVAANPVGFYDQDKEELLVRKVIPELRKVTSNQNPRVSHPFPPKVIWEAIGSIAADLSATSRPKKLFEEQLQAITQKNPNLAKIKSPVVLVLAKDDSWSEAEKIVPKEEIEKRLTPPKTIDQIRLELSGSKRWDSFTVADKEVRINQIMDQFADPEYLRKYRISETKFRRNKAKRGYLKEEVMPQANAIGVIEVEKYAHHGALAERPQTPHLIVNIQRVVDKLAAQPKAA